MKIGSALSLCAYTNKRQKLQLYESEDFDKKRALFDKFVEEKGFSGWYETSGWFEIKSFVFLMNLSKIIFKPYTSQGKYQYQ